jgi:hypothetical protein
VFNSIPQGQAPSPFSFIFEIGSCFTPELA